MTAATIEGAWPGGARHPWEEEPEWEHVLARLGLEPLELLVELESAAELLWERALATLEAELELDPALSHEQARCRELGPWAWLRSTPLYVSLERQLGGGDGEDVWAAGESSWPAAGAR